MTMGRVRTRDEAAAQLQKYFISEALEIWDLMNETYGIGELPRGAKTELGDMKQDGLATAEVCYAIWRTAVQTEKRDAAAWEYVRRIAYNILGRRIDWKGAAL